MELKSLVSALPFATAIFDLEMRHLACSERWAEVFHHTGQGPGGRSYNECLPKSPAHWETLHRRCLEGETLESEGPERFEHADGSVDYLTWRMRAWHRTEGGIGGVVMTTMPATKEVKLRSEMAAEIRDLTGINDELRRAHRIAGLGNFSLNTTTNVMTWSDELFRIHGLPVGVAPAPYEYLEAIHAEDQRELIDTGLRVLQGDSLSLEYRVRLVNGEERWMQVTGGPDPSAPTTLKGVVQDITQRRSLEEQLRHAQRLEAVGRVAGSVAHDFNNLLTAILSFSTFALERTMDQEVRTDIETVISAAERGTSLTRRLLTFARRTPLAPLIVDLRELIASAEPVFRRLIHAHIELDVELGTVPVVAKIDPVQFEQILLNLVVNSGDAMADQASGGRISIAAHLVTLTPQHVSFEHLPTSGRYALITVTDNGMGMTAEVLARATEPFYTSKPEGAGTGLGLSTCNTIASAAGGYLRIYSEPGSGTTVRLYLPASGESTTQAHDEDHQPTLVLAKMEQIRILVVDDDEQVRSVAIRTLKEYGYVVFVADSVAAAKEILERQNLDLVLTDVVMPGGSGMDLLGYVPNSRACPPVMFMSGYAAEYLREKAPPSARLLPKPFSPKELIRAVSEVLVAKNIK
jgi:two-component system, cell cycle sensor histidine kinase and response regulator CckA